MGDHNFCVNPDEDTKGVWCLTTDPKHWAQYCSVPLCPPLKALDFSLDNDDEPDENNSFTHASLQKENLPPSFTIFHGGGLDSLSHYHYARLFVLHDDTGKV